MVSSWRMTRSAVFVSALATSVELPQTCVGAVGFSPHPLEICAVTTGHLTADVPSCAHGRAPIAGYICSPHEMFFLGSGCRGSGQHEPESCLPPKLREQYKKNGPTLKSSQTSDDFSAPSM